MSQIFGCAKVTDNFTDEECKDHDDRDGYHVTYPLIESFKIVLVRKCFEGNKIEVHKE